jgi:phospho-N-acetylmuramoyl-pentapeptide-transferase
MLQLLSQHQQAFGPFRLFDYITFRAMGGAAMAFLLSLALGPALIRWLTRLKIGQHVRDDEVLAMQRKKAGTPTMGGLMILLTVTVSSLVWAKPGNFFVLVTLAGMLWSGMIGFIDDWLKVVHKNAKGLAGRYKILIQLVGCVLLFAWIWSNPAGRLAMTQVMVPFLKGPFIENLPLVLAFLFFCLVVVSASNAVNVTDGMDGLAIGCSNSVALAYLVMSYVAGHVVFAEYLKVPYIPESGELAVYFGCLLGGGLGFLWFNAHPARVFMGDTGSLALGGGIAVAAMLIQQELVLVLVGGVFVMEALSVVIQVASFKLRGKRVFRCAPIHHHFEMVARDNIKAAGRDVHVVETLVTTRLWILSILFAILGVASLKIR